MKTARKVYDLRDAIALLAEWEKEDRDLEAAILAEVAEEGQPKCDPAWTFPELDITEEGF